MLRLYLLGSFDATLDGQPLRAFRSDKTRALLAYLVLEGGKAVRRSQLATLLWDGYARESALSNLRMSLTNLRQLLAPLPLIRTSYQTVQFNTQHPDFWCDALLLERWEELTGAERQGLLAALPRDRVQQELLSGFETINSAPFQQWLQERRQLMRGYLVHGPHPVSAAPAFFVQSHTPSPPAGVTGDQSTGVAMLARVPTMGDFQGRQTEQAQLLQWLVHDRCRVVALVGMGGQGKTALAAHVVRTALGHHPHNTHDPALGFEEVLWSSLVNAPPLDEVLQEWLQTLSHQQINFQVISLNQQLTLLLELLQRRRVLLVLDNFESILRPSDRAGYYRPGYEAYEQLLTRLSEYSHQSCLLLTSREEPHELERLGLGTTTTRSLRLSGLTLEDGQAMLERWEVTGSSQALDSLINRYSGNPLALKLVAATVREFFGRSAENFLSQDALVFDDIRDVLDQHFARLLPVERTLLTWLAIEREPTSFAALWPNLIQPPPRHTLLEAVRSLQRRSLLEQRGEGLELQNVVLEYVTDRLTEQIFEELQVHQRGTGQAGEASDSQEKVDSLATTPLVEWHLNRFALVKAQSKEYVRASQVRLLLRPIAERLLQHWSQREVALHLQQLLQRLRVEAPLAPGYAAANILHLLLHLNIDVRGYDFSKLALWQAYLRQANLPAVNFTQADFTHTLFLEPFQTVRSMLFTLDGQQLITGANDGEIHIWRLSDYQPEHLLSGHRGPVRALALSADGQWLASGSTDHTIRLWERTTGALDQVLSGHSGELIALHFTAGGELLSVSANGEACLWAVQTPRRGLGDLQPHTTLNLGVSMVDVTSVTSTGIVVVRDDSRQKLYLWDVPAARLLFTFVGATDAIHSFAISPDGHLLASSDIDKTIRIYRLPDPAERGGQAELRHCLPGQAEELAFRNDGQILAITLSDYQIVLWNPTTGEQVQQLSGHTGWIRALAFRPDGDTLASAGFDQTIRLWNLRSGEEEHILYGHSLRVELVMASPDGATLLSMYHDHTIHIWNPAGEHQATLRGHQDLIHALAYSPDGTLLASSSDDQTVRLWHIPSGEPLYTLRGHTYRVRALTFHPTGTLLATSDEARSVAISDVTTGELCAAVEGFPSAVYALQSSPDGTLLAIGGTNPPIWLVDFRSGQLCHALYGHKSRISALAFHPDGTLLASSSDDHTVRLWQVTDGQLVQTLVGHTNAVSNVCFTKDGHYLVSTGDDRTIRVWSRTDPNGLHQLLHQLPEHTYKSSCVVLTPDDQRVVSGRVDGTVRLWDIRSGLLVREFKGHSNSVMAVDVSTTGHAIYSCSSDGTVRIWATETGECRHVLYPERPYTGMNITGITGITEAQKFVLRTLGAVEE
jgi:WD40 repeat protein